MTMTPIKCIIPVRQRSSRLPNKPLIPIDSKPLIQHAFDLANECEDLKGVLVAVDESSVDLIKYLANNKIPHVSTPSDCRSGTERIASILDFIDDDLICNFQGDIVYTNPSDVDRYLTAAAIAYEKQCAKEPFVMMPSSNRMESSSSARTFINKDLEVMFSSRRFQDVKGSIHGPVEVHGIYVYNRAALEMYKNFEFTTVTDTLENLEFMRFVELGIPVKVHPWTKFPIFEVNYEKDIDEANEIIRKK